MGFVNSTVVNYPVEEVFNIFVRTAKRDFPKFDKKNPVGCAVTKKVGTYSAKSGTLRIEITDYKENETYQITSVRDKVMYVSTYTFQREEEGKTRLTLEEVEETPGAFQFMNTMIQKICFKGTIKRRFGVFVESLEKAIEDYREKVAKAEPKDLEEIESMEAEIVSDVDEIEEPKNEGFVIEEIEEEEEK